VVGAEDVSRRFERSDDVEAYARSLACGWTRGETRTGAEGTGLGWGADDAAVSEAVLDVVEAEMLRATAGPPQAAWRSINQDAPLPGGGVGESTGRRGGSSLSFSPAFPAVDPRGLAWLAAPSVWGLGFGTVYGAAAASAAERAVQQALQNATWHKGGDAVGARPHRAEAAAVVVATAAALSELLGDAEVIRVVQQAVVQKLADAYRLGPGMRSDDASRTYTDTYTLKYPDQRPSRELQAFDSRSSEGGRRGLPVPVADPQAWDLGTSN